MGDKTKETIEISDEELESILDESEDVDDCNFKFDELDTDENEKSNDFSEM